MHKWLWIYIRKFIPLIIAGIVFLVIERVALIGVYGMQMYVIDDVMAQNNYEVLKGIIVLFSVSVFMWIISKIISTHVLTNLQVKLENTLCKELFESLHQRKVHSLEEKRTGEIYTYFSEDVVKLSAFLSQELPKGIQKIIAMIVLIIITIWLNPVLFIFITVFTIVYLVMGKVLIVQSKQAAKLVQINRSLVMSDMEENVVSVKEIIANHKENWIKDKFLNTFQVYYDSVLSEGKVSNKLIGFRNFMRWGLAISVLVIGGVMVMKGQTTLGSFIVVYHFSSQLLQAYDETFQFLIGASGVFVNAERLMKETERRPVHEGTKEIGPKVESISMDGVQFSFSEQNSIIRNLDFTIQRGHKIALVGSSGSGKSTVAKLLMRHHVQDGGTITINGIKLEEIERESLYSKLAIVFQEPFIFSDSLKTNITLGREGISGQELHDACAFAQLDEWIQSLPNGIDTLIGGMGGTISGGQKQRIALARAILCRPEVLILDESTSALDLMTERKIIGQLDRYRQEQTTIIISHRLSIIENADCIYVMEKGMVLEKGDHKHLMNSSPKYREFVDAEDAKSYLMKVEASR